MSEEFIKDELEMLKHVKDMYEKRAHLIRVAIGLLEKGDNMTKQQLVDHLYDANYLSDNYPNDVKGDGKYTTKTIDSLFDSICEQRSKNKNDNVNAEQLRIWLKKCFV